MVCSTCCREIVPCFAPGFLRNSQPSLSGPNSLPHPILFHRENLVPLRRAKRLPLTRRPFDFNPLDLARGSEPEVDRAIARRSVAHGRSHAVPLLTVLSHNVHAGANAIAIAPRALKPQLQPVSG